MLELQVNQSKLDRLDKSVRFMLENYPIILAGGAVRDACFDETICDYDIFFMRPIRNRPINVNFTAALQGAETLEFPKLSGIMHYLDSQGFKITFECPAGELFTFKKVIPGADTVKDQVIKVQLICKRNYYDVEDLLHSFDFNATRFAISSANCNKVVTDMDAVRDVVRKKLTIHNITYPASTINRLYKYRNKGYYVGDAITTIVAAIAEMGEHYRPEDDALYVD